MNKIYRWMRNEVFLNTFVMSEDVIKKYINVINEDKAQNDFSVCTVHYGNCEICKLKPY